MSGYGGEGTGGIGESLGGNSEGGYSGNDSSTGDPDGSYGRAEDNRMAESAANRAAEANSESSGKPSAFSLSSLVDLGLGLGSLALNVKSGGVMGALGATRSGISVANTVQGMGFGGFGRHSGTNQIGGGDAGISFGDGGGDSGRARDVFSGFYSGGAVATTPNTSARGVYDASSDSVVAAGSDPSEKVAGDVQNIGGGGANYVQQSPSIMPILLAVGAALLLGA